MEHRRWHRPLELPQAVLVRKYKHAPELGVTERFGRAGLERFAEALRDQVRGAAGAHRVVWRGRVCTVYRGEEHLVVTTPQGRLITAHRATAEQLAYVRAHPEVEP
jgi:hypothetical protein